MHLSDPLRRTPVIRIPLRLRLAGNDPGRARLVNALAVTTAVGLSSLASWLVVRYEVSDKAFVTVGVLVALQMGAAVKGSTPRDRLLNIVPAIVPLLLAPTVAVLLERSRIVEIIVFIVVAGAAVWARRLSPRAGHLGTITFFAYFYALFLQPGFARLGGLLLILVLAWVCVVLVRLVLLKERPARQMSVLLDELRATSLAAVTSALDVKPETDRSGMLDTRLRHVDAVAKAITVWQSRFDTADTLGISARQFANLVLDCRIDAEQAALEVARMTRARGREATSAALKGPLDDLVAVLTGHLDPVADAQAHARAAAQSETDHGESREEWAHTLLARTILAHQRLSELSPASTETGAPSPDDDGPAPASRGSGAQAPRQIDRLALQAMVAAGLAAGVGELIDDSRWYWAVMASFMIYLGSTTRSAVLGRASHRVVGTLAGIIFGLVIGFLIDGPSPWHVIFALISVFGALYFGPVIGWSFAFFTTVLAVSLYGLLGVLHPNLLAVRLEETAAGAAVGVVCAYLVFSASSRPAFDAAATGYLDALRALVGRVGDAFTGKPTEPAAAILSETEELDAAQSRLADVATAMSLAFSHGRWSRANELKYLVKVSTHAAEHAGVLAMDEVTEPLAGPQAATFTAAVDHVKHSIATTEAALASRDRPTVDANETSIDDVAARLHAPANSDTAQAALMLARVNWAMLRIADLRTR